MTLYSGKIGVTVKEYFATYVYKPFSSDLSKTEKRWVIPTSLLSMVFSLGLVQLICWASFSKKKINLFTRHNGFSGWEMSNKIKFLIERLNRFPNHTKTKVVLKKEFDACRESIKCNSEAITLNFLQEHLLYLKSLGGESLYKEIGGETEKFLNAHSNKKIKNENSEELKKTTEKYWLLKISGHRKKCLEGKDWDFWELNLSIADYEDSYKNCPNIFDHNLKKLEEKILGFLNAIISRKDLTPGFKKEAYLAKACYLSAKNHLPELKACLEHLKEPFINRYLEKERQELIEKVIQNKI